MPVSRKDQKSIRQKRREGESPVPSDTDSASLSETSTNTNGFTDEQLKLRAMIPALTPAHGPESTSSAILGSLALGHQKPNSHTRKKSDGHVNRPPNAFIVFRRAQVQHMPANITQHQQRISNLTASFWRVLTAFEQKSWYDLADDIKKLHSILFPEYNFNPRNADGSKKPAVPHAGLTNERLEFAWNEAQILINKHSAPVDYVIDGPAPSGKLARPKAPRKGQGTRAKERRQLEAAQRAAMGAQTIVEPISTALLAAHVVYDAANFDDHQFYADDEPISNSSNEGEGVQWSADFALDASVSSRSSPSNTWSESVGPLDGSFNEGQYDPAVFASEEIAPDARVASNENLSLHFNPVDPFPVTSHRPEDIMFNQAMQFQPNHGYVDPIVNTSHFAPNVGAKQDASFMVPNPFNGYPMASQSLAPYYTGAAHVHTEVNVIYDYHSIDPAATYLDTSFGTSEVAAYGW